MRDSIYTSIFFMFHMKNVKKVTNSAVESNRMGKSAREEITTFQLNAEYIIYNFHSVFIVMF